ncbi:MAG: M23 family metallopeptidase, partial [Acidimicrobiales bacterium]
MSKSRVHLVSVVAALMLTTSILSFSVAPAVAQPLDGRIAGEVGASPPTQSIASIRREVSTLRSEMAEYGRVAQRALAAADRGDLDRGAANEVVLSAMTHAAHTAAEIARLTALVSGGAEFGLVMAVFPVGEVSEFIDSWGFGRSGGRRHKGTDILAPRGAELLAVESGQIQRQSNSRLGGLSVYLLGDSGARYYYTHLEELGPQQAGDLVAAGDLVGFVGDSGNARGTTHL